MINSITSKYGIKLVEKARILQKNKIQVITLEFMCVNDKEIRLY